MAGNSTPRRRISLREPASIALETLRTHKLRSFLTLLGVILSMTLVMMTSLSVTRETERGTMESLLATPVQPLEVMAGKLAPYVVIGLIQTTVKKPLAERILFGDLEKGGKVVLGVQDEKLSIGKE